ncbi:hypothetical protein GGS23DRAFT_602015 [Durotheca rogersii]|uniref:uncharacterized protein n=1 Tax=Durotheca rogersii TaxID=419775 RepID=UPI00221F87E4|nr:uncharacterized protein GGS23DRAFT_602015 [Durotheca rogersii]KAI5868091.1 hypothetical protein GGS23DRAFT_602015 [Durotheca rogersii]
MSDTSRDTLPSPITASFGRIKRNTACTSCRDAKVRCNPGRDPAQPFCQRCAKLGLTCVVDRTHKRVSRKSKLDELVQEIRSIKQSVGGQSTQLLPTPATNRPPQDAAVSSSKEPGSSRLGMSSPASAMTAPEASLDPLTTGATPAVGPPDATVAPSSVLQTPTAAGALAQNPPVQPSLPRALGSQPFSGEDIDYYFQKYFECFHPYMPIVRCRDPNRCYESGTLLFWTIVYVAARRYARGPGVFGFLLDAVRREAAAAVAAAAGAPLSLAAVNALLLLCTWMYPDVRFLHDPSALFAGVCMNAALQLGVHTGRGAHPEFSHGAFQSAFSDEDAAFAWAGYNVVAQRVASTLGIPPLGALFNRPVQDLVDGRAPFPVPPSFRVLLECQRFCHRLGKTMAACLEESRGVSPHVVQLLEDEWDAIRALVCSERADDLAQFYALLVQLEIQTYYFMPAGDASPPCAAAGARTRRDVVRAYHTARAALRAALALEAGGRAPPLLRHLPHFHFRALLAAACVVYRLRRSSYMAFLDGGEAARAAADAVAVCRAASVADGDLPMRAAALLDAWSDRLARCPAPAPAPADDPRCRAFSRQAAGVAFDCITRWKSDHLTGLARASAAAPGPGANDTPAALGGAAGVAAPDASLPHIDWSFIDDFDWNFEAIIPVAAAPP